MVFRFFRFGFFHFFRFFRFVLKQFVSVVSRLFRNREFRLNQNKQKTHPNSLKESIFGNFSENLGLFRFVSFCFGLLRNRSVCFGCFDIGSKHWNKPKQTRNRSCFGLFRFKPKCIFVCFEDNLSRSIHVCRNIWISWPSPLLISSYSTFIRSSYFKVVPLRISSTRFYFNMYKASPI